MWFVCVFKYCIIVRIFFFYVKPLIILYYIRFLKNYVFCFSYPITPFSWSKEEMSHWLKWISFWIVNAIPFTLGMAVNDKIGMYTNDILFISLTYILYMPCSFILFLWQLSFIYVHKNGLQQWICDLIYTVVGGLHTKASKCISKHQSC